MAEAGKKKHSLKEVIGAQIVGNIIGLAIVMVLSILLVIALSPEHYDRNTVLGFIACAIPFFTIIHLFMPIYTARVEYIHGELDLEGIAPVEGTGSPLYIWELVVPRAFLYGVVMMLIVYLGIKFTHVKIGPTLTGVIAFVALVITTTPLIKHFILKDLPSFAAALNASEKSKPVPMGSYLFMEHAFPFMVLQGFINACIANRGFPAAAAKIGAENIPIMQALIPDFFFTVVIIAFLQWMFSNAQSRCDVRLGRCDGAGVKKISGWAGVLWVFLFAIIADIAIWIFSLVAGLSGISFHLALIFKVAVAGYAVICGAWIGIRFGASREYEMMQGS